jgi:transcriptional regulator with XRE-family HTH domain
MVPFCNDAAMELQRLKQLLGRHGVTQSELAQILGRDKSVVTHLFQGKRMLKADEALRIAKRLGVSVEEVLGSPTPALAEGFEESPLIPFQSAPQKLKRHPQVVQKAGQYFLDAQSSPSPKAFALEVRDDSLNLAGILPGDVIISELDVACRAGQIVVVQHYKGAGAETLLRKYEPPFLLAHSTNPDFSPMQVQDKNIRLVAPALRLIRLL